MRARLALLVALVATVTLVSVAAAGPAGAKQRVAINSKDLPQGTFVLEPLQAGTLEGDSGRASIAWTGPNVVTHGGQSVYLYRSTWTFEGKRGSLTIRERSEWVDVSNKNAPGVDFAPGVGIGTWKVVRGTGAYAGITGGGRSGHAGMGRQWLARLEGFLTLP